MGMTSRKMLEKIATRRKFSPPSVSGDGVIADAEERPAALSGESVLRIFLVDDSRLVVERLIALLATVEGVQIIGSARTTSAAIRGIQHLLPDLVILDFQLTDGTGIHVLKAIKQGTTPPLVLMLTNFAYPQYRTECVQWGADYFFDKSQDFEQVVGTCRHLLSTRAKKLGTVTE